MTRLASPAAMAALLTTLLTALLLGCGGAPPGPTLPTAAPERDEAALRAAARDYYTAADPAAMRAAVAAAAKAGPATALHHEIAADLALFEDRPFDALEHLVAALLDPAADAPVIYLHELADLDWTFADRRRLVGLFRTLAAEHPDPETRAFAAWMLAHALHLAGDDAGRDRALAGIGEWLPLAVIGPFENDQGQGFDAEHPPERAIDLGARHPGKLVELTWRTDPPRDPRGKLDLGAIMHPAAWQVAYAAAGVEVREAGRYELRVSSSDPLKVWVNDALVFEGRRLGDWLFDGLVIPVDLRRGSNRVLIKSAQETGSWLLTARLTGPAGAPLAAGAVKPVPADTPYAGDPAVAEAISDEAMIAARITRLPEGPRRDFLQAIWADDMGLRSPAVALAEAFVAAHPTSVRGRYRLAAALWDNAERGRTADLLNALDAEAGDELPFLRLKQARFWRQQKLDQKARAALVALRAARPDRPGATRALADLLEGEGWHEERCAMLADADARWPGWPAILYPLADCREDLRFYPAAEAIYRRVHRAVPHDTLALRNLQWLVLSNDDFEGATALADELVAAWPHLPTSWTRLAETRRRAGDREAAEAALRRAIALQPTAPNGYRLLAELALQAGRTEHAVSLYKEALARDPENDGIANRIAWLAPAAEGPWIAEAPDQAALDAAVAARASTTPHPAADVIYLLDDEVTRLGADGSAQNVVTLVAHAVNQAGRDRLTRMNIRSGGRHRLLHAYAVDPQGRRVEASSIRGRTVRFRQLTVGSTVVLQYRIDERPDSYLAGHVSRQWWFQGGGTHVRTARWVAFVPKGTTLREQITGDVQRSAREVGDHLRVEWSATDTPPIIDEPNMPVRAEFGAHVVISTVPDWNLYWTWEQALLVDAFRESPDLEALAAELLEGADTAIEKVRRIHTYLIESIRYQQDYERTIAGVKPHAAPVVLARQYGDCKDKAVLFITLARMAGIEAHYALVRTRDAGPVRRDVPMQQFNHAIVYVPAQPGIDEGRFYDPTVDALDVDVLRHDDQGTWSLVYDPIGQTHEWREIPYQDPSVDFTRADLAARITDDGAVTGEMALTAHGRIGSVLRRAARNPETLNQLVSRQIVSRAFPAGRLLGVVPVQVESIREPAQVRIELAATSVGRREGRQLRMPLPIGWTPEGYFTTPDRRHDLLLGTPRTMTWSVALELPPGAKIERLPETAEVESPCLTLSRTVRAEAGAVQAEQRVQFRCERLAAGQYEQYRKVADDMIKVLQQELVITVGRGARAAR